VKNPHRRNWKGTFRGCAPTITPPDRWIQAQPRHADAVTQGEASRSRAESLDNADDLMTRDDPRTVDRQITLDDVEIRPAHPAGAHPHQRLTRTRSRVLTIDGSHEALTDRAGYVDAPDTHVPSVAPRVTRRAGVSAQQLDHGIGDGRRTGRHTDLREDVRKVPRHRLDAEDERRRPEVAHHRSRPTSSRSAARPRLQPRIEAKRHPSPDQAIPSTTYRRRWPTWGRPSPPLALWTGVHREVRQAHVSNTDSEIGEPRLLRLSETSNRRCRPVRTRSGRSARP